MNTMNNYIFVNLIDADKKYNHPIKYGWVLKLVSTQHYIKYLETIHQPMMREEFKKACKTASNNTHAISDISATLISLAGLKEDSLVSVFANLSSSVASGISKIMQDYGFVYIQSNGSYMSPRKSCKELKRIESKRLIFPGNLKPRYSKWSGGKHWYAKVGNSDVVVDGVLKWNTKEQAKEAVKIFLKGANK